MLSRWRIVARKQCVLCHVSNEHGFCPACADDLSDLLADNQNRCPMCAGVSALGAVCGRCQQKPPPFELLWAPFLFEPPLSNLLYAFKHLGNRAVGAALAEMMVRYPPPWLTEANPHAVLALPLSQTRLLQRGFNQSDVLARAVASYAKLPLLPPETVHRKHHSPQSTLNRKARLQNIRHAFSVQNEEVKGRNLLLIDDVVTTGATMSEIAQTLKQAGAKHIFCWALARPSLQIF